MTKCFSMTEHNEISEKALWRLVLLAMLAAILLGRRVTAAEQRIQPQLDKLLLRASRCLTTVQQYCGRCLREFPRCSPEDLAQAGAAMTALAADVERLHQLASVPVCCPADVPVAELPGVLRLRPATG